MHGGPYFGSGMRGPGIGFYSGIAAGVAACIAAQRRPAYADDNEPVYVARGKKPQRSTSRNSQSNSRNNSGVPPAQ